MMSVTFLLILLVIFQIKHLVADFILQTGWMVRTKGIYGHPGGIVHAGLHAVLTAGILLLTPLAPLSLALIVLGEFVLHYHLDWFKDRVLKKQGYTAHQKEFWTLAGLDQFAHQLSYVLILYLVVRLV